MAEFARASLGIVEMTAAATGREKARFSDPKDVIEVQFNPTSLKLQYSNLADAGGVTARAQPRQNPAVQPSVLSFDLEYDTAEEDGVDVRTRTATIRRFVQSPRDKPKSPAPLVQFRWGTFVFNGRVTQITEDIDYFSSDGSPLRAKLSVSITEQDPSLEANATGPGARTDDGATDPGSGRRDTSSRPGRQPDPGPLRGQRGTATPQRVLPALAGETLQDLARRAGGSPAAWRALAGGIDDPLNLPAGVGVEIGPEIDASVGVGVNLGFAAGVAGSADRADDAAEVVANASAAATDLLGAGLALANAGGIAAAAGRVAAAAARAGAETARASFLVPAASPPGAAAGSGDARAAGAGSADGSSRAGGAAAPDPVDPRALAYGRSVPLRARPQISTAANSQAGGSASLAARARPREAPVSADSGIPWEALTPGAPGRSEADRAQRARDARPSTMRWRPGGDCP